MELSYLFTFVTISGEIQPFNPTLESEWDNLDESTKQNGTTVWAINKKQLMEEYAETLERRGFAVERDLEKRNLHECLFI